MNLPIIFSIKVRDWFLNCILGCQNSNPKTEATEAFVFEVNYANCELGCIFRLFLIVTTQAMAAETVLEGSLYIPKYFAGISGMMILTILLAIFAKDFLLKNLRKILPYMEKITAVLLIIAGVYVIYYQMALFVFKEKLKKRLLFNV